MTTNKQPSSAFIVLLALLSALGAVTVDLYLPSMPRLALLFNADKSLVQQTMSYYLLGFGIGQIFFGPLLERFGRRPVLLASLLLYVFASILCVTASSIHMLLLARCLQAIGACGPSVGAVAIVRDVFPKEKSAKMLAVIMIIVGFSPAFAPIVGGYLQSWFDWRAAFVVLSSFGLLLLLWCLFKLPETHQYFDKDALKLNVIFKHCRYLLTQRIFIFHVLINTASFACLVAFVTASPFLLMKQVGLSPHYFGYAFGANALALMIGGIVVSKFVMRFSMMLLIKVGLVLLSIGSLSMLVLGLTLPLSVWTLIPSMIVVTLGLSMTMPNSLAIAMTPFPEIAGIASALSGTLRFGIAGVGSVFVSYLQSNSQLPLAWFMTCLTAVALVSFYFVAKETQA